jgi:hypothetical protein
VNCLTYGMFFWGEQSEFAYSMALCLSLASFRELQFTVRSPRIKMLRGILAKIRPEPPKASLAPKGLEPKRESMPPIKHYEPPRAGRYRRR